MRSHPKFINKFVSENMIKGLDDDEVDFLDLVDRTKMQVERQHNLEEARELQEYRQQVASLQEKNLDKRLQSEILSKKPKVSPLTNRNSQKKILTGVVVKKRKLSDESSVNIVNCTNNDNHTVETKVNSKQNTTGNDQGLKCIGILPGMGVYRDTSDSEESTDSDVCDKVEYDLLGRKIDATKKPVH